MTQLRAVRAFTLWIVSTLVSMQLFANATPALAQAGKIEKPDITFGVFPITNYGVVYLSLQQGFFQAEGLNVTIDSGPGSVQGIGRIAAGTYPMGFFDINSLAKFLDQNPDKKVQAVLMMYDNPAFAIASLAKTNISKPKDLEGKCSARRPRMERSRNGRRSSKRTASTSPR